MGYKRSVSALPNYTNNVQGTISQSSNPLAMAISGQGFFAVSETTGSNATGVTGLQPRDLLGHERGGPQRKQEWSRRHPTPHLLGQDEGGQE